MNKIGHPLWSRNPSMHLMSLINGKGGPQECLLNLEIS